MKFRTEIKMEPSGKLLDPRKPVTLLGSCFTQNIGMRMRKAMWKVHINPCGVIYNPYSVGEVLAKSLLPPDLQEEALRKSLTTRDGVYVSWLFDSSVSGLTPDECVENGMKALRRLYDAVMESQATIVTWGSAHVYRLKATGFNVVNNCHKHPASEFLRTRLSVEDIVEWNRILANSFDNRLSHLSCILTVSPVRYLSDGAVENALSKSTLLLAADKVCDMFEQNEYFPAYELLNDDLRDYRFYADDMVHPSERAIDYVWEKFQERYLSEESRRYLREGRALQARIDHRPIIEGSDADIRFRAETDRLMQLRIDDDNRRKQ